MNINQNSCICNDTDINFLRPYEKCMRYGTEVLSDVELLAVILRVGTNGMDATQLAGKILTIPENRDGLLGLASISISRLMKIKGVGRVKAIQIKCICELSRRMAKQTAAQRMDFSSPDAIADYYMQDLRYLNKEHMILVMLDSKCRLIHDCVISMGTVNASLITPGEIFSEALKFEAVSIVLLHNHPSGDATPSRNDIEVTRRIAQAGSLLGINLIDHIVIGDNAYTSLREKEFM